MFELWNEPLICGGIYIFPYLYIGPFRIRFKRHYSSSCSKIRTHFSKYKHNSTRKRKKNPKEKREQTQIRLAETKLKQTIPLIALYFRYKRQSHKIKQINLKTASKRPDVRINLQGRKPIRKEVSDSVTLHQHSIALSPVVFRV